MVSSKLYALSTGNSKDRATVTGKASDVKFTWDTISLITGNTNITESMTQLNLNQAEASQVRVFEYMFAPGTLDRVFPGVDAQSLIFDDLGKKHYGAAGRVALRDMMFNREKIRTNFALYRKKYGLKSASYDPKERFYVDLICTAYVGAKVFKDLGYISFDIDNARDWAMDHMLSLRSSRAENSYVPEDKLAQFLSSLYGNLLVTKYTNQSLEAPMDAFPLRGEIKARMGISSKEFFVSQNAFDTWCFEKNLQPGMLKKDLLLGGFITPSVERMSLTKNTSIPSSRQRVIAFDYNKIMISEAGKDISAKVVNIK
jgi:hypothetical protein